MTNPVIDFPWIPSHVDADAIVFTGKCVLHTIVVNGLTTAGDATVYDGVDATGTVVAVLHLDPATSISVQPITFTYDCRMDDGIFVDFDDTLAADLTVNYH